MNDKNKNFYKRFILKNFSAKNFFYTKAFVTKIFLTQKFPIYNIPFLSALWGELLCERECFCLHLLVCTDWRKCRSAFPVPQDGVFLSTKIFICVFDSEAYLWQCVHVVLIVRATLIKFFLYTLYFWSIDWLEIASLDAVGMKCCYIN